MQRSINELMDPSEEEIYENTLNQNEHVINSVVKKVKNEIMESENITIITEEMKRNESKIIKLQQEISNLRSNNFNIKKHLNY